MKQNTRSLKLAEDALKGNKNLSREANGIMDQLRAGNMTPGIGTKHLFKGIFEVRGRVGARVYFRVKDKVVEILGYSNKSNQQQVIDHLFNTH